ncbi:MAG: hypothetical protein ACFFD7_02645 [Candidatus Thorarchaeota archaeon]
MLEDLSSINEETVERLKKAGIDTIEKLALKKVNDLLEIEGFTITTAVTHIQKAIDFLNSEEDGNIDKIAKNIDTEKTSKHKLKIPQNQNVVEGVESKLAPNKGIPKKKIVSKKGSQKKNPLKKEKLHQKTAQKTEQKIDHKLEIGYIIDLFPEEIIPRIRFLHFKLKKLEPALDKSFEFVSLDDLDLVAQYVDLLNINYKSKNQNLVLNELAITKSYYDPIDNTEFEIYDIMFECARVCWVAARLYAKLSKNFEKVEDWDNAIIYMVKCSRMYKSATYFSTAAINQNKVGKSLEPRNLEFESEQSRIYAQSIVATKEEKQNNLVLASKLFAGLSSLSRRLLYLGTDSEKIKKQLHAQSDFDMGKACYLLARALENLEFYESSDEQSQIRVIEDLFKKAVYYFSKSEETWEEMVKKIKDLTEKEKGNILFNLSVVNDNIMEIDAEVLPISVVKDIKNPEPYIAVPENLPEILPRTIAYFSNMKPMDMNVEIYRKYKIENLEKPKLVKKEQDLLSKKMAIGRTIKELKSLFDNNDIDVIKYTELYEKYTKELHKIEKQIQELKSK